MAKQFLCALLLFLMARLPAATQGGAETATVPVPSGDFPHWDQSSIFAPEPSCTKVSSGSVEAFHSPQVSNGFVVKVEGRVMGSGAGVPVIGYVEDSHLKWLMPGRDPLRNERVFADKRGLFVECELVDSDGGVWQFHRHFTSGREDGTIDIDSEISVDQQRWVACLPGLLVFPGTGAFGTNKAQGLFAGLEYLDNEPSSSEADVIGPASNRSIPDPLKITFPLMIIQAEGRYVGLTWRMRPQWSALFDSPDRLFHSGGHVMGIVFPGASERDEGKLLARSARLLHSGEKLELHTTLLGGAGESLVPALQQFVRCRPLPPLPPSPERDAYVSLMAKGWLDSKIREGTLVRHAVAQGGFDAQPAADAALWMTWLAAHDNDRAESNRLAEVSAAVLSQVPAASRDVAGVGHIRYPVESLVSGDALINAQAAEDRARSLLTRFDAQGSVKYTPAPGKPDYSKTHFTNEASGFASRVVLDLLEAASISGNRELVQQAIDNLRALDRFKNGVPRGAQTWECPLHTPDILASAQMVDAYLLGYQLTGEPGFLQQARYWAWTGLPFVYLVNPTEGPVGLYATIAVFGATNWRAPVWLGLPVQWCGLVYAEALYRLARFDDSGPWKRLADGITISGIQQTWPDSDENLKGLLPDSFELRKQNRNGPAINPATLMACAAQLYDTKPIYEIRAVPQSGVFAHAPGKLTVQAGPNPTRLNFDPWFSGPCSLLLSGVPSEPRVKINGKAASSEPFTIYDSRAKRLLLRVQDKTEIELSF